VEPRRENANARNSCPYCRHPCEGRGPAPSPHNHEKKLDPRLRRSDGDYVAVVKVTRPSLVIFDMDDVLCHYDLGRRLRALARLADVTARDVRAAVWDSGFEDLADQGGYAEIEHYLAEFGTRLGRAITLDEWIEARSIAMQPNEDVLDLASKLGQQAALAIYTNNGPVVKNHLDKLFPEAAKIFKQRYCSYEFGTKKPDPKSYTKLLETIGEKPDACWFIDDKKSNVEGARLAGLRAHHYTGFDGLIAEAKAQGFEL